MELTTWHLEQTDRSRLVPAGPARLAVEVVRAEIPSPEFSRFLYTSVGGGYHWTDRLGWSRERWAEHLDRPQVETWVAWHRGTPAGYVELEGQADGVVEILYFGLLPYAVGAGVGGLLLSEGAARAWDMGERVAGREPTRRVWVHTCSMDGPYALANYRARGFTVFRAVVSERQEPGATPGPWPGAE
ncbi:GNAT family N-acetyltransferase [Spongiactinospora sp. TRM90649]|uniref:GNAT family N-acetyltransferase n=1 Tax=Spongiactinospora sp. TRM90649 TaxID=3031114 RepID=UPI0023F7F52C|nr:GNAT family N-acetyltransferase [Spongiactinospora sp. TRM90649]MDF5755398.1 GNAT family N-acetyltransferase [Spongiactinospora sp. TRM90649]